jgi:hypothetical protein
MRTIRVVKTTVATHVVATRHFVGNRPETMVTAMMSSSYMYVFGSHGEIAAGVMACAYVVEAAINWRRESRGESAVKLPD